MREPCCSPTTTGTTWCSGPMSVDWNDWQLARLLWQVAVGQYPDNAEVTHHAAGFLGQSDLTASVELAKRAQMLDPPGHTQFAPAGVR
jgi:hypothetical protein